MHSPRASRSPSRARNGAGPNHHPPAKTSSPPKLGDPVALLAKACAGPRLESLTLRAEGVSQARHLRATLRLPLLSNLVRLDVSDSPLQAHGASILARELLVSLTKLTSLGLANCRLGDEGVACLVPAFVGYLPLVDLDLAQNGIGQAGAVHLSKGLLHPLHEASDGAAEYDMYLHGRIYMEFVGAEECQWPNLQVGWAAGMDDDAVKAEPPVTERRRRRQSRRRRRRR